MITELSALEFHKPCQMNIKRPLKDSSMVNLKDEIVILCDIIKKSITEMQKQKINTSILFGPTVQTK